MIDIALHIEYLLSKHDCVILPGWGAYILQCSGAIYDCDVCLLKRPVRKLSFNPEVNHNDGLLVNSLMRRESLSFEEACIEVELYVSTLKKQLDLDGEVHIDRIGSFGKQNESLVFNPYQSQYVADDNYGLGDFKMTPLSQLQSLECNSVFVSGQQRKNILYGVGRTFARIAASIVLLVVLALMLSTPIEFSNAVDYAGFNSAFELKSIEKVSEKVKMGEMFISLPKDSENEVKGGEEDNKNSYFSTFNEDGSYYLIVSSLPNSIKANEFVSENDKNLRILNSDGRYRVYVAQSDSYNKLLQILDKVSDKYPSAWIYRKSN